MTIALSLAASLHNHPLQTTYFNICIWFLSYFTIFAPFSSFFIINLFACIVCVFFLSDTNPLWTKKTNFFLKLSFFVYAVRLHSDATSTLIYTPHQFPMCVVCFWAYGRGLYSKECELGVNCSARWEPSMPLGKEKRKRRQRGSSGDKTRRINPLDEASALAPLCLSAIQRLQQDRMGTWKID